MSSENDGASGDDQGSGDNSDSYDYVSGSDGGDSEYGEMKHSLVIWSFRGILPGCELRPHRPSQGLSSSTLLRDTQLRRARAPYHRPGRSGPT